jgi:hypothetical protein
MFNGALSNGLFDSYKKRKQALETLADGLKWIDANYDSDPTNIPALVGKVRAYQYAFSNAVPHLDPSDDGDRELIGYAKHFDEKSGVSNADS